MDLAFKVNRVMILFAMTVVVDERVSNSQNKIQKGLADTEFQKFAELLKPIIIPYFN